MQNITESEFQREVEALKAHRRTSVNRPLLDPDLPETAAAHGGGRELLGSDDNEALSPTGSNSSKGSQRSRHGVNLIDDGPLLSQSSSQRSREGGRSAFTARRRGIDGTSQPQLSPSGRNNNDATQTFATASSNDDTPLTRPLDPSHLFWVPASMHPEISPSDFRRFLQDHTSRAVREQQQHEENGDVRPASIMSTKGSSSISSGSNMVTSSPTSPGSIPLALSPISGSPVDALMNRSTSIARRGSTLRRQYKPESDQDDDGPFAAIKGKRRPSMQNVGSNNHYGGTPTLSIDDLQRLERLAEEASKSSDPTELRSVLRRTMSLNVASSALDQVDAVPAESEQDAPLIVPRPGQILRRAARTKIRKASFSGETQDGPSRPGIRRRAGTASPSQQTNRESQEPQGGAEVLDKDNHDMASVALGPLRKRESLTSEASDEEQRRTSDGHAGSILDAYSRDSYISEEDTQRTSVTSLTDSVASSGSAGEGQRTEEDESVPLTPTQDSIATMAKDRNQKPGYFDLSSMRAADGTIRARTVSSPSSSPVYESPVQSPSELVEEATGKGSIRPVHVQHVPPVLAFEKARPAPAPPAPGPPALQHQKSPPPPMQGHGIVKSDSMPILTGKEGSLVGRPTKEKKTGFGLSWFGLGKEEEDKASKREKKEKKEREREKEKEREAEALMLGHHAHSSGTSGSTEKDSSSFLGSLFGKKKGNEEVHRQEHGSAMYSQAGHITAGSLLDMRTKGSGPYAHYYRYPIHVERAVYRLSHIKLANPRRPLYEQVLISNLMFWYLSIINRSQQQQQQQLQQQQQQEEQSQQPLLQPPPQPPAEQAPPPSASQLQPDVQQANSPSATVGRPQMGENTAGAETDMAEEEVAKVSLDPDVLDPSPLLDVSSTEGQGGANVSSAHPQPQRSSPPSAKLSQSRPKRGGLVKPNRAPPGSRAAETAIPAAGYGAQHRKLNSEMASSASAALNAATGGSAGSNGYGSGLSVGQIVDPRTLAAFYEPQSGSSSSSKAKPSGQPSGDEHSWLGRTDRRSPGAEERRSDPLSESSSQFWDHPAPRKGFNRASEPTMGDDGSRRTVQRASGDSSNVDTLASSPSTRSVGSSVTTASSNDHLGNDKLAPLLEDGAPDSHLMGTLAGSKDAASAMLDAARTSQSRRR